MQSVLVSIVGYFFLVGKYGIRVGDRVQIGGVTGDVLAVGLVRLYLMELAGQNMLVHTGRVVAFANSIVFQVSSGLFKQLPGVDFSWHEITVTLPPGIDYAAIKRQLSQAITDVLKEYRDELERQTQELHRTAAARFTTEATPQVQLRFSATGADALVRYPVRMRNAAEVDERISEELYKVIASFPGRVNSVNGAAGAGAPLPLR
jgi:small-conductance mechanosensitive channel